MGDDGKSGEKSEYEQAADEMREFEQRDEVPADLADWPTGKAKYVTYGEGSDEPYGEGPTEKLGPAEVERREDGSVVIGGEEVDADEHKAEPITSGIVEQIEESKKKYAEIRKEYPELQDDGGDDDKSKDDEPERAAGADG